MATKIRLQRHGKKRAAYYHIVVADSRSKRDGKLIERLGAYNPNTNPATIELNFDRALHWVKTGAEPTDTARAILSYKGVMMKSHLDRGVLKGAHSQEDADAKFEKWLGEKEGKIQAKSDNVAKAREAEAAEKLKAESEQLAAKLAEMQAKEQEAHAAAAAAEAEAAGEAVEGEAAEVAAEAQTEEAPAEEAKAEAPAEEAKAEAPAEEAKAEAPAEEAKAEAPTEEAKAEAPAEEAKAEAPAEEAKAEAPAEEAKAEAPAEEAAEEEKKAE
jgi:small subunit ribosomal protein S16